MSKIAIVVLVLVLALTAAFAVFFYRIWPPRLKPKTPKLEASPEKFEFTVCLGEEARGEVRVENVGGDEAHVSAGLKKHKGVVNPSSFILGVDSWRNVTFSIKIPKPGFYNGSLVLKYEDGSIEIPIAINVVNCSATGPAPPPAPSGEEEFDVILFISVSAKAREEGKKMYETGGERCVSSLAASEDVDLYLKLEKIGENTYRATGKVVIRSCRVEAESLHEAYTEGKLVEKSERRGWGESEEEYTYLVYMVIETGDDGTIINVEFLLDNEPVKDLVYPAGSITANISTCAFVPTVGAVCENRTVTNVTMCVSYLDIKYALEKSRVNLFKEGVYAGSFEVVVSGPEGLASSVYACKGGAAAVCLYHLVSSYTIHFTARVEVKRA